MGKIMYADKEYAGGGSGTAEGTSEPTADMVAEFDSNAHMNSTDMTETEVDDFVDTIEAQGENLDDLLNAQGEVAQGTLTLYRCTGTISHNNLYFYTSKGGEIWLQGRVNVNKYVRSGANGGFTMELPSNVPTPTKSAFFMVGFQSQHPREYIYLTFEQGSRTAFLQTSESFDNTTNGTLTFICSGRVFVK